ncbi:potassium transporter Kup [Acidihalobacter aeolianus]|uniref:Probable potassium transport system protein Kup n=2 Tax=Acidihalobacter aeolianus TaxID=2792603 RepID=A0A1D8KCK4_9GAMM|nr:potassium transporter Kup [Acidihalobacter aeolianus]
MALGIVYGDIGTSPLYALHACFYSGSRLAVTPAHVIGILSLIFWALIVVISIKYVSFMMRADNRGEGGILALLALLDPWGRKGRAAALTILLGSFGASLLYGDGMITPAISVLSAVGGLKVAAPMLKPGVIPITVIILLVLFATQRKGTARLGRWLGPIMLLWFTVLALMGIYGIVQAPAVLAGANPLAAVRFVVDAPSTAFLVLGSVFLVVTGGETLYADMGHFGAAPIRWAWFGLVLPALLLNYFGQGALLLRDPAKAAHPFYSLVPSWGVYPMILLATVATVIASQAVISGAYSLARQSIQMGFGPRLVIVQTSDEEMGQIYMPGVNLALMVATIAVVVGFGSTARLAGAYGVAVSATMAITTTLAYMVMRRRWQWSRLHAGLIAGLFLIPDLVFLSSNLLKVPDGGWLPLLVAAAVVLLMSTWRRGMALRRAMAQERGMPIATFLQSLSYEPPTRVRGTGVFLCGPGDTVPQGLLHHLKLNQVLHERVLLMTATSRDVPRVPASERLEIAPLGAEFYRVFVNYGFMQTPNLSVATKLCQDLGVIPGLEAETTTFFADRLHISLAGRNPSMPRWRHRLFAFMARNAQGAVDYYRLPPGRSVELGIQIDI